MSYGGYNNPYAGDNGGGGGRYDNGGGRGYSPNPNPFGDENATGYGASHEMDSFGQQGYGASPRPMRGSPAMMGSPAPGTEPQVLREVGEIQRELQKVESMLQQFPILTKRILADADTSGDSEAKRKLDLLRQDIMDQYRLLVDRVRQVKSNPESQSYSRPVENIETRVKAAIQKFQDLEADYRRESKLRMERELRIANPNATDEQIDQAVEDGNTQVFQQAVMGNRTEQANRVLGAVRKRHEEMLRIERSLIELVELLNTMQELLVKQEVQIQQIANDTENAGEDLKEANVELGGAIESARGARKKKWWLISICIAIVVIIVVAVVAYILVNRAANGGGGSSTSNNNNSNNSNTNNNSGTSSNNGNTNSNTGSSSSQKRSLFQRDVLDDLQMNTARAATIHSVPTVARRRVNKVRGVAADDEVEVTKRFVVDWDGVDPTGSEN